MKNLQIVCVLGCISLLSFLVSCKQRTQTVKEYNRRGQLIREFKVKDGVFDGVCKTYFPSGKIQSQISYVKGKMDGITKNYHNNGKLFSEIPIKNNKREGDALYYYEDGRKPVATVVYKDDRRISKKALFKNGKTAAEFKYKDNLLNGDYSIFTKDGKVFAAGVFRKGHPFSGHFTSTSQDRVTWQPKKPDLHLLKYEKGKLMGSEKLNEPFDKEWYFYFDI